MFFRDFKLIGRILSILYNLYYTILNFQRALDKTVPLRIQNRPPFLPNRIKMTQFQWESPLFYGFSKIMGYIFPLAQLVLG